jgi:hypothetical protein
MSLLMAKSASHCETGEIKPDMVKLIEVWCCDHVVHAAWRETQELGVSFGRFDNHDL